MSSDSESGDMKSENDSVMIKKILSHSANLQYDIIKTQNIDGFMIIKISSCKWISLIMGAHFAKYSAICFT
jgi:hypothetical protein